MALSKNKLSLAWWTSASLTWPKNSKSTSNVHDSAGTMFWGGPDFNLSSVVRSRGSMHFGSRCRQIRRTVLDQRSRSLYFHAQFMNLSVQIGRDKRQAVLVAQQIADLRIRL